MSAHLPRNGQLDENTKALQWKFKASGRQLGDKCVCATVRWRNVVVRSHLPQGRVISMLSHKSINRLHKGQNAVTMTFIFKV